MSDCSSDVCSSDRAADRVAADALSFTKSYEAIDETIVDVSDRHAADDFAKPPLALEEAQPVLHRIGVASRVSLFGDVFALPHREDVRHDRRCFGLRLGRLAGLQLMAS